MNTNLFKTAFAALVLLFVFNSCEKKEKYTITVTCNPEEGTVTGSGEYEEGEEIKISATANSGYFFARWDGTLSTNNVLTVKVSADKTYTAIFGKFEDTQYGSVKIVSSKDGKSIIYEAKPNKDCYFVGWSNAKKTNPIELEIDASPITANFIKVPNTKLDNGSIVCNASSSTVKAIADDGYYFWKWSDGTNKESIKVAANTEFNLTPIFRQYPEGSIHALFSVGKGKRVIFSKGNLQFNPTLGTHTRADGTTAPGTWRFAEKQTEYFKGDSIVSATYDGWICHFAWGTSGWSGSGATYYQPYDGYIYIYSNDKTYGPEGANTDSIAKLYGPQGNYDLIGDYAYADWGVYNPISNGGNKPGMWRTLSRDEFYYFAKNNYKIQPIIDFYCFYDDRENSIYNDYKERNDKNLDDWIKIIDAKNDLLFFYNYLGLEVWTVSSDEDYDNYAEIEDVYHSLIDVNWIEDRSSRHPVRLVMDVEE